MQHAKEYLVDYALNKNSDLWLKKLIYEIIQSNGSINPTVIDELYSSLVNETPIDEPTLTNENNTDATNLHFISLKHNSGVSALADNQIIKFCDNVTIMYGLNGSGKSSYFRVLNEIVGGNQKKEILPNIYKDFRSPISVDFVYKEGNNEKTIHWNNTQRAYPDLTNSKIFDSSYLNSFLDTHIVDQSVIQPFGLHLFSATIEKMDELKKKIKDEINSINIQESSLSLDTENFSDTIKALFLSKQNIPELKKSILEMNFSNEDGEHRKSIEQKINELNSSNLEDRIRFLEALETKYQKIQKNINDTHSSLITFSKQVAEILQKKKEAIEDAKTTKEKIILLKDIPGNKSSEWENFIKDGITYSTKNLIKNVCPYCRQALNKDAENLILAYSDFLNDKSQKNLANAEREFNNFKESLNNLNPSIEFDELIENDLKEKNIFDNIKNILKRMQELKNDILLFIDEKKRDLPTNDLNIDFILQFFNNRIVDISNNLEICKKSNNEKNTLIDKLKNELKILKEKESVTNQKEKITQWFTLYEKEQLLNQKAASIKTNSISSLANLAYKELVSETLLHNFIETLSHITGSSNMEVSLKPVSINKGVAKTQLILTKGNCVHNILSEGEQKAVGLALFLAEIKTQASKYPIILDDPVNSLDHKIASNFAELILSLDNQVIIFSHNKLFIDAFECSKQNHICKTTDTACCNANGKHIKIYSVSSEGKNHKGVLTNYKGNHAKNHIDSAKKLLQKTPFSNEKEVASFLRRAIECVIDEKILNNFVPTKFSNKNSRINWEELRKIEINSSDIDSLQRMHSRLSGGDLHNGTEAIENPIEKEEFTQITQEIERIIQ